MAATETEDGWEDDIEQTLAKGVDMAIARVRGIDSIALLNDYLEAEIEGESRRKVIGAINQRKQALKESCPRGCDAPVLDTFTTDRDFQIKHQNAVQWKTCLILEDDHLVVVFHEQPRDESPEEPEQTDTAPEIELTDEHALLLDRIEAEGRASTSGLSGYMHNERELDPDTVKELLQDLIDAGEIEQVEPGGFVIDD